MTTNKILIVLITIFIVLVAGCSNGTKDKENKIVVEKQANGNNQYEIYTEIMDNKKIQNTKDILNSVNWENGIIDMAYPPHYKFYFEDTSGKIIGTDYELWISPNKDKIEIVISDESKYVQLDKDKSEALYKIITDKNLNEVNRNLYLVYQ